MQKKSNQAVSHSSAPKQVRIIAGQWKRTPLTVVEAPGLRPTPDRVRETVFNWLSFLCQTQWSTMRCLDVFAGSGALGFEAASRGAGQVTLLEAYTPAAVQLEKIKLKLNAQQVQIIRGDARQIVKKLLASGEQFDVIFLDPPFHTDLLASILPDCVNLLHSHGYLYMEAEKALTLGEYGHTHNSDTVDLPSCLEGWQVVRSDSAGKVYFHLLQRTI